MLLLGILLAFGSGVAALIYEVVWFQVLELVIGSTAVSLGILLATFMGGMCLGSWLFPRIFSDRRHPLRVYALIELGIGIFGLVALRLIPLAGSVYTAWSGYGMSGLLLRGLVAIACLLPPTLLMGATLPALARQAHAAQNRIPWLGFFYGANIAGAVLGCLLAGFLPVAPVRRDRGDVCGCRNQCGDGQPSHSSSREGIRAQIAIAGVAASPVPGSAIVYLGIALSGLCALAAEAIWTRIAGTAVRRIGVRVFHYPGGLSGWPRHRQRLSGRALPNCFAPADRLGLVPDPGRSGDRLDRLQICRIAPLLARSTRRSRRTSGFTFELDLARALWALLPPTRLWGASFPLALRAAADRKNKMPRI